MRPLTRRRFLQTAAVATAATHLPLHATTPPQEIPWPENGTLIPDDGWRLWIDEQAPWQQDDLFLPDEITRASDGTLLGRGQPLPIHPPTGGWSMLTQTTGKQVTLPTTVEQHFWGHYGAGPTGKPRPLHPRRIPLRRARPSKHREGRNKRNGRSRQESGTPRLQPRVS